MFNSCSIHAQFMFNDINNVQFMFKSCSMKPIELPGALIALENARANWPALFPPVFGSTGNSWFCLLLRCFPFFLPDKGVMFNSCSVHVPFFLPDTGVMIHGPSGSSGSKDSSFSSRSSSFMSSISSSNFSFLSWISSSDNGVSCDAIGRKFSSSDSSLAVSKFWEAFLLPVALLLPRPLFPFSTPRTPISTPGLSVLPLRLPSGLLPSASNCFRSFSTAAVLRFLPGIAL